MIDYRLLTDTELVAPAFFIWNIWPFLLIGPQVMEKEQVAPASPPDTDR